MFWKEIAPGDKSGLHSGFFAPPDACGARRQFATHVDVVQPVGDRGVVFSDELDTKTARSILKYVSVAADGVSLDPQGAFRIRGGVRRPVVSVGADPSLLVFDSTGASPDDSGLFVFGPVPF
jgi:hypothetical protein